MGRLAENTAVRLALFVLIATVLVWGMIPQAAWLNEFRDAQVLTLHERAASLSVRQFGQLPLWDPLYCGGIYGLGAPQSRFASPTFLFSLVFGVERAQPLVIFLFAVLGMEGTYRFVRVRVDDATAALRVAPLFALSGHFAVAYFRGWTNFFGFELVPWVLYGVAMAARGRTAGLAIGAIAFAVMLGFGGTFAAPIVAVAATVEALRSLSEVPPPRRARAILMLSAAASFMVTASAVRLLPVAETLSASPRIMAGTPGHAPKAILDFLVKTLEVKNGDVTDAGAFYVGAGFLALVALGGAERKAIRALVILILFLWLTAGYARKPPLFALLRTLPVFSALRYPERFLWIAILYACEPAAHALTKLPLLGEGRRWRVGANIVLTAAVLLTVGAQVMIFNDVGKARELGVVAQDRVAEFRQSRGNRWLAAHYDGVGSGSLSCWEAYPVVMSPKLRGNLLAEEYLAEPSAGSARRVFWSPNRIVVHVTASRPVRLLVNQNWHPGWHASIGAVVSDEGLLAIDLPQGENDVTLEFKPRSSLVGGVVTLVALASLIVLGLLARHGDPFRRRVVLRTTALLLAPWAAFLAGIATWSEPRYPTPVFRNANGTPAVAAEVPAGAAPIHAQLDVPIVLDAVEFAGPDALKNLAINLYLRRTGAVPRTTGMFVHVVRRDGQEPIPETPNEKDKLKDFFNADHQVVAASFYLSDAPEGKVIHDAFGVQVGRAAPGKWDVWVAFGHVSGRRGRARVTSPGESEVNDDRVRIGSFTIGEPPK